jgi:hypothetical protein
MFAYECGMGCFTTDWTTRGLSVRHQVQTDCSQWAPRIFSPGKGAMKGQKLLNRKALLVFKKAHRFNLTPELATESVSRSLSVNCFTVLRRGISMSENVSSRLLYPFTVDSPQLLNANCAKNITISRWRTLFTYELLNMWEKKFKSY